jgi:hypothetical protein
MEKSCLKRAGVHHVHDHTVRRLQRHLDDAHLCIAAVRGKSDSFAAAVHGISHRAAAAARGQSSRRREGSGARTA